MSLIRRALATAITCMVGSTLLHGQLQSGDLLIVDAGTDRLLQYDASTNTVAEAFTQNDFRSANGNSVPGLSGEIHYDENQAYLYLSGTTGNNRLYRADVGNDVVSLGSEQEFLDLQTVPEASVNLTGKAIPISGILLLADTGVSNGSIYGVNLRTGTKSIYATEQDYLDYSSGNGSGMTDLDFVSLVYQEDIANYWLLSGGNGQDSGGNNRSAIFRVGPDGQPLEEFVVSGIDEDWQHLVQSNDGDFFIFQSTAGNPSVITVDSLGTITPLLSPAEIETIFGVGVPLSESLAVDPSGLLYLLAQDGTVYSVDPSNPGGIGVVNTAVKVVAAQDYVDDTTGAVTDALGLAFIPAAPVTYTVTERSEPANLVTTKVTTVVENRYYTVALPPIITSGRHLSFWSLNGVRVASSTGRGLFRPTFIVTEDIDAVAQYYEIGVDGDGDRLEDWWEFWMFGDRTQGPQDDIDGDGFDHETEFNRGLDATLFDQKNSGGVAGRLSPTVDFVESGIYRYIIESEPFGILQVQEGQLLPGQSITTPYLQSALAGHEFVGWEVDGTPVTSPDGLYLNQITVTPSADTRIVAKYILTGEDSDADLIEDSFEWQQFGSLVYTPADDPDGDGFDIEYEKSHGLSVVQPDTVMRGGISARLSPLVTYVEGKSLYSVKSLPLGIIPTTSEYVDDGTVKTTTYYNQSPVAGYEFVYWSVNGTRIADPSGVALRQVTTTVSGATEVVAHFVSPTRDNDADGILDTTELHYFGTLSNTRGSNPDGDAFTLGEEIDKGYSLTRYDTKRPGGIAARSSQTILFNSSTKVKLDSRTSPLGIAPSSSEYYETGTEIVSTRYQFQLTISGFYFTHFTINGTRVTGPLGNAREQAVFDITEDTELIAHFTSATADTDSDGILDYVELRLVGDLAGISPNDDLDGDGILVEEELRLGFGVLGHDTKRPGGIAGRMGNLFTLDFVNPPLVVDIPDPALKTVVANALGLDPDGDILVADMLNLTSLDASGLKIISLRGLEAATNLTSLYLNDNRITDIRPLAGLSLLQDDQNGAGLRIQGNFIDFTDPRQAAPLDALLVINNLTVERDPQYPQGQVTVIADSGQPRAFEGVDLELWVTAVSQSDIAYQWYKDGAKLPGQISPILSLPNILQTDSGQYELRMTDVHGTFSHFLNVVILRKAELTVNIRDGVGMWKYTSPYGSSGYLPSGATVTGLAENDVVQIDLQPIAGYWSQGIQRTLQAGNNIIEVAYLSNPDPFTALGQVDLISPDIGGFTEVFSGSKDGSVLGGSFWVAEPPSDTFIWTDAYGLNAAPDLPGSMESGQTRQVRDVSDDGRFIIGRELNENGIPLPIIWEKQSNGYSVQQLPPTEDGRLDYGWARSISGNNRVIAGRIGFDGVLWHYDEKSNEWQTPVLTGFGIWENQTQWDDKIVYILDLADDGAKGCGMIFLNNANETNRFPFALRNNALEALPFPAGENYVLPLYISDDGSNILGIIRNTDDNKLIFWNRNDLLNVWEYSLVASPEPDRYVFVTGRTDDGTVFFNSTDPARVLPPIRYAWDASSGFIPQADWLWSFFRIDFGADWEPELIYANIADGVVFGNLISSYGYQQGFRILSQGATSWGQVKVDVDATDGQPFMWRIDGGSWVDSQMTVWAPVGSHDIEFMQQPGYTPVEGTQVNVVADTLHQVNATPGLLGTVGAVDPLSTSIIPNDRFTYYRTIDAGDGYVWASGNREIVGYDDNVIAGPVLRLDANTGAPDPAFQSYLDEGASWIFDTFPDGSVLVSSSRGSDFTTDLILKVLPSGEFDPQFHPFLAEDVRIAKVLADGKILLGESLIGTATGRVTRLMPNGVPDPSWQAPILNAPGANARAVNIWAKFVLDDQDRILIGGLFTDVNGEYRPGIARLLPNGELDTSFNPQVDQRQWRPVRVIGLQSDGKIVMGPETQDAAQSLGGYYPLVRMLPDGEFDYSFNIYDFDNVSRARPRDMVMLDNDSMVIAGDHGVVRLLSDGAVDVNFTQVVSTIPEFFGITDYPDSHYWIDAAPDGYYVSGTFDFSVSEIKEQQHTHYGSYKIDPDGNVYSGFNPPRPFTLSFPDVLLPVSGEEVLITGESFPNDPERVGTLEVGNAAIINLNTGAVSTADAFNGQLPAERGFQNWIDIEGNADLWYGFYRFSTQTNSGNRLTKGTTNGVIDPSFDVQTSGGYEGTSLVVIDQQPVVSSWTTNTANFIVEPDGSFLRGTIEHFNSSAQWLEAFSIMDITGTFAGIPTIGNGDLRVWDIDADGNYLISMPDSTGYPVLAKVDSTGSLVPSFTPLVFIDTDPIIQATAFINIGQVYLNESKAEIRVVSRTQDGTYLVGGRYSEVREYAGFQQEPSSNSVPGNPPIYTGSPLIEIDPAGQLLADSNVLHAMSMNYASNNNLMAVDDIVSTDAYAYIIGVFDHYRAYPISGVVRLFAQSLELDPSFTHGLKSRDFHWQMPVATGSMLPNGDLMVLGQFVHPGQLLPNPLTVIDLPENPVEYVSFADSNLQSSVEQALGLDPGDPITTTQMAMLQTLDASNMSIVDLSGLEYAVNLNELNLSQNNIADLRPIQNLGNLQTADLEYNYLDTNTGSDDRAILDTLSGTGQILYATQNPSLTTYEDWAQDNGIVVSESDPFDTSGSYGIMDIDAYAMGLDPDNITAEDLPKLEMNGDYFEYIYSINLNATGVELRIECSVDLITWEEVDPINVEILSDDGNGQLVLKITKDVQADQIYVRRNVNFY